ncbi:MAG: hemerythrin domain-containing protein [Planctomycetota bacterium]
MRATEILVAEHQVILRVLDCLEKIAEDVRKDRELDLRSAGEILDFLGNFADRCHHGKEEGSLFPALGRKGMPNDVGPVAVMLMEHAQGREQIAGMRAAFVAAEHGRPGGAEDFSVHARTYVDLLRDHIAKENHVLFPMADRMLNASEQAEILEAFGRVESHDLGAGTHERYLALADALVARLGLPPSARPLAPAGGCCGHGASRC